MTHNTPGPRSGLVSSSSSLLLTLQLHAAHSRLYTALLYTAHPEDDAEMEEKSLEDDYYLTFDRHAYYTLYL